MARFSRRDFLKAISLAGTAAAMGCSPESGQKLIPYIISPEDIIPGEATWYATTCRECPAGCGLLAKNRDGRVIKVEGNPLHPINRGTLCPRGQASVQGVYNPDRIRGPMIRNTQGSFDPIPWEQAEKHLADRLQSILQKGREEKIASISELNTGSGRDLLLRWLGAMGSKNNFSYEPLAYEPLREANRLVFGSDDLFAYRLDRADLIISFGADFLETWISNVEYARQFGEFRTSGMKGEHFFSYIGPRLSLTAANADQWLSVPAGSGYLIAIGLLRLILEENRVPSLAQPQRDAIHAAIQGWTLEAITAQTGVKREALNVLAQKWARAKNPLALTGGLHARATETAVAANLICTLSPGTQEAMGLDDRLAISDTARAREIRELSEKMKRGEIDLLLILNANPRFFLPPAWEFDRALKAVPMVVSLGSILDETSAHAHLILPSHTPLESWGDFSPKRGLWSLMQPVMGPMFHTRHFGDILLSLGKKVKGPERFPWPDFYHFLRESWKKKAQTLAPGTPFELFWLEALKRGGVWQEGEPRPKSPRWRWEGFSFPKAETESKRGKSLRFMIYPTIHLYDGRGANRPWLQELPDPLTQITWGTWVEIHPDTAQNLGIQKGDVLSIRSPHGIVEAPAYPFSGIHRDTMAMPLGQGHTHLGRFANLIPGNPSQLLAPDLETRSGGVPWSLLGIQVEKMGKILPIANTDGSLYQHGRNLAQAISYGEYQREKDRGSQPHLRLPIPEAYDRTEDFYPPHAHAEFRWAMTVDLHLCIGCGACVVACYAENNVAIVQKEQILKGREMSWLRIERYLEGQTPQVRFLPMMCQHCDNAPCEAVCPVFAPHHSKEGLNNQVYNRCIGTRFCSQNCPYKVRRFNWFTFLRPEPLNWQLNPDVTVRHKGVMEKCSFCIQRIVEAKVRAKSEGRAIRDGEFTTACAQTCPTRALTFGNLMDPGSMVSQKARDVRAYQVLGHLNTKPAVIYLKKIIGEKEKS